MADGVPLEISVAIIGGEGVDDVRTVVMNTAAAVGLCKFSCNEGVYYHYHAFIELTYLNILNS